MSDNNSSADYAIGVMAILTTIAAIAMFAILIWTGRIF
jgi:hypothetical protein